ncbi:DUF2721 domain-containing protein [Sphingomicrobium flavum]|uniref:DUF2721 domain-containing protein n=1 Tax=Sphingomicrobium flavum TaxID=1229164 RepID=UPI0021AD67FF|nr:DUF2721 domain-containing protein [Sphingomicrobium flavum]
MSLSPSLTQVAADIQLAVAPVFLLAGIGAFLNVSAGRLARITDRARQLEPRILAARGAEHDKLLDEVRLIDTRIRIVNQAISLSVLAAVLVSGVVVLLFAAGLAGLDLGREIALLFIAAMIATGAGFAVFLWETRLAIRSIRVAADILEHQAED